MSIQFKNKQAIDLLAKLQAGGFPSAIVAGGCVRDEIFGKPVKDIDVFVSYEDVASWYTDDHIEHFVNAVEREVTKEDWSSYCEIPNVDSVYTIHPVGEELSAQIIVLSPGLSPLDRLGLLDFGFCQAAWDGKNIIRTVRFNFDYVFDCISLVHCENQHEFDRSMVRYERLKQKYPTFKLVIPHVYRSYQCPLYAHQFASNPDTDWLKQAHDHNGSA